MIFATSTTITFYALFTANKLGKSGIVVKVAVNGPSGNIISVASSTSAVEVDSVNAPGLFLYSLSAGSTATEGGYTAQFTTADATVDQKTLQSLEFCANWIGKTNLIGAGTTTYTSPVNASGTVMTVVVGNDYKAADGRSFDFTVVGFPSFSGGTAKFSARSGGTLVLNGATATVLSATQLRMELTRAQTLLFTAGTVYTCDFAVTLADGDTITPLIATLNAVASVTP